MSDLIMAYVPCADLDQARALARLALEQKLVACANILPNMESHYWWQDKLESTQEVVLIFKTLDHHQAALKNLVEQHHSYECPALVFWKAHNDNPKFLNWLSSQTKSI